VRFVAFFRNVNLGQPRSPSRAQLESAFLQAGASTAISFMSNGTLIFSVSDSRLAQATAEIACETLRTACGMREPAFVRRYERLAELAAADPFSEWENASIAERAITFFDNKGGIELRAPIESQRKDCLIFRIDSGEAFSVMCDVGGKVGYPTPVLEKALGAPVTTRGWTTILRMVRKFG